LRRKLQIRRLIREFNNEVMFSTEGYSSKASAKNAIESFKKNGPDAEIEDTTD